ncbi:hypothetical protein O4H48_13910 [Rhodobacteraceae bacterium G21628-S1]|nr:hypothetical protein [Rhodobacteraceae bacterium G21628-S1]
MADEIEPEDYWGFLAIPERPQRPKVHPTRGQQLQIADHLDDIADEKLIGCPLGPTAPFTAQRLTLGAAYRLVASDMRSLSDGES